MKVDTVYPGITASAKTPRGVPAAAGMGSFADALETAQAEKSNKEKYLDKFIGNAAKEVREAWDRAEEKVGVNALGVNGEGRVTHITAMRVEALNERIRRELLGLAVDTAAPEGNLLGSTVESAISLTEHYLSELGKFGRDTQPGAYDERRFYQEFLQELRKLL